MAQRLAAVAVGAQAGVLHHVGMALAHQRDLPRAAVVGRGGVQAQEALFLDRLAVLAVGQHAHVVHVAGAVQRGAGVGLGQDQRVDRARVRHVGGRQRADQPRRAALAAAHQAQAAALDRAQYRIAPLLHHFVLAEAEEDEVVVRGPAQELLRLLAALLVHRQPAAIELVGHLAHALAHRLPVAHDRAHVGQHRAYRLLDARHGLRRLAVDLQVHQRLRLAAADPLQPAALVTRDAQDRVPEHVHADAEFGQRHGDRVDQERHVVVGHLQDGVRRFPAVRLAGGVEQPHQAGAGLAAADEVQEVRGQRGPAFGGVLGELVLAHALVERIEERLGLGVAGLGQLGTHRLQDRLERDRLLLARRARLAGGSGRRLLLAGLGRRARGLGGGLALLVHGNRMSNYVEARARARAGAR